MVAFMEQKHFKPRAKCQRSKQCVNAYAVELFLIKRLNAPNEITSEDFELIKDFLLRSSSPTFPMWVVLGPIARKERCVLGKDAVDARNEHFMVTGKMRQVLQRGPFSGGWPLLDRIAAAVCE
jgi:hypothetical protein